MKNILILMSLTGIMAAALAGALAVQDDWARERGDPRRGRRAQPDVARRPASAA